MRGGGRRGRTGTAAMPQYSYTDLEEKLARAQRERDEAREQQAATSEILRVISRAPTDVHPTFDAIAASATRLCDALNALVIRFDGQLMHLAAHHSVSPDRLDVLERIYPIPASRGSVAGRSILSSRRRPRCRHHPRSRVYAPYRNNNRVSNRPRSPHATRRCRHGSNRGRPRPRRAVLR